MKSRARAPFSLVRVNPLRQFSDHIPNLDGQTVFVSGGTGSFGQRFLRELVSIAEPQRAIVFSRDELKQSEMAAALRAELPADRFDRLRFFIGDVRDRERLMLATRNVDIIIHAAALKQVPAAEYNPSECIHTNVLGAENIVWAALHNHVKQVIALSTDKACNPINLYGATKLASDKVMIAANNLAGDIGTRFAVVRYGNVIGSRGSIVPLFRQLAVKGVAGVPITDPRMTRFWITLDQGVRFVLSCLGLMRGGEIFVPKIPSMRITDLAETMLPGVPHEIIGIRPGEKLHEQMISQDDARTTVELTDRYVIEPAFAQFPRKSFVTDGAGTPTPERFSYASDSNQEWLTGDQILSMLEGCT